MVNGRRIHNKSFASGTFVTLLIVAMLIFSGPAQAVSVIISGLEPSYPQGTLVNFSVSIDIIDLDKYVPVTNISIKVNGLTYLMRTFTLDGTPISGDSIISITQVQGPGPSDYGYGYGYGMDHGYGYNFGYGYGYGYGYGGGGNTLTYIYNVSIETTSLQVGSYTAIASLNTGNAVKKSFDSAPGTFEITAGPDIELDIDINPKSINPESSGIIKVTISNNTPEGFDVADINISSVRFGKAPVIKNETTSDKKLMLFFNTEDTGIHCGDTQAILTGKTKSGLNIVGTGSFVTTGCGDKS